MPCRRSWVRIPSAAYEKAPLRRGFSWAQLIEERISTLRGSDMEAPAEELPTLRVDAPLPARAGRGDLVADEGRLRVIRDQAANRLAPRSVHPDSSYVPGVVARDEDEESFDRDDSTHIRGSSISVSSRSGSGGCSDGHRCSRVPASPGRRRLTQDSCCEWNYSRSPAALRAFFGVEVPSLQFARPALVGGVAE